MARDRQRHKGRREKGHFAPMPHVVCSHPAFIGLSAQAKALLFALFPQLRFYKDGGNNNGDLCATWSVLRSYGWRSKATLEKALRELEAAEVLVRTRQGGRHRCTLYALSWLPIGECTDGLGTHKLDVPPTKAPPVNWHRKRCPNTRGTAAPSHGAVGEGVSNESGE